MLPAQFVERAALASCVAIALAFGWIAALGGPAPVVALTKALFAATVLVEMVACTQVLHARRSYTRGDAGFVTWSFILAFFCVRILAELRLLTLTFELVPDVIRSNQSWFFVYVSVFRYLYTISDLMFIAALWANIRAYQSTGLSFTLLKRDYAYISAVWLMPVAALALRENLMLHDVVRTTDIATYRLMATFLSAVIVSLCLIVRRYVAQMGGGMFAGVWNAIIVAGLARGLSFVFLGFLSARWIELAAFLEQALLWAFACAWWVATLRQRELGMVAAHLRD